MRSRFRIVECLVLIAVIAVGFRTVLWYTVDQDPKYALSRKMNSRSVEERRNAAIGATTLFDRPEFAVPILVASLKKEKDPQVRVHSLISLGCFGKSAAASANAIEPFLNDADPRLRAVAARSLIAVTDGKMAHAVVPLIDDRDPNVRAETFRALLHWKLSSAVPIRILGEKIADPDPRVRIAASALLRLNGPSAFPILPRMLDQVFRTEDRKERERLWDDIFSIGRATDRRLFVVLFQERAARALRDSNPKTRQRVLNAYASSPFFGLSGLSVEIDDFFRKRCRIAMDSIRPLYDDPDPDVRGSAIQIVLATFEMIGEHPREIDLQAVEKSLIDPNPSLRARATFFSRFENVIESFSPARYLKLLRDPNPGVRRSTLHTLGFLDKNSAKRIDGALAIIRATAPELRTLLAKDPDHDVRVNAFLNLTFWGRQGLIAVDSDELDAALRRTVAELIQDLRSKDLDRASAASWHFQTLRDVLDRRRDLPLLREAVHALPRDEGHKHLRAVLDNLVRDLEGERALKTGKPVAKTN